MTTKMEITQHFVTFLSPGSFVREEKTMPIAAWDTDTAQDLAADVVERHGARPFCFYFTTRGRSQDDLDSSILKKSSRYFINCHVQTLEEVQADPASRILAANMESANWTRVATTRSGFIWTDRMLQGDAVLED